MSTTNTDAASNLSAELEAAKKLLEKAGMTVEAGHSASKLLTPEKTKKARAPRVAKAAAKTTEAPKADAAPKKVKVAKAKAAAPAAPRKPRKGTTGQSGPVIENLTFDDLNNKERLLVGAFELKGEREIRTIEQLADEVFKGKAKNLKQANSWARNSLRRLMRSGKWLEKVEPGKYRLTVWARKTLTNQD
jgi:hypothetical protein